MNLQGKVAVVTGGAVRLGKAFTLALAEQGCDVLIHYGKSEESARETQATAKKFGIKAHIHSADLLNADEAENLIPQAIEHFGKVDILINSAAIFPEEDTFTNTDKDEFDNLFAINLRAPYLISRAFAQQIPADGIGKIINIVDARVRQINTDHFVYRLTKQGLWTLTEMLALELAPKIMVNAVALGAILPPPGQDHSYLDKLAQEKVPVRCAGSPELVARMIIHLLQDDFYSGVIVPIDGAQFL